VKHPGSEEVLFSGQSVRCVVTDAEHVPIYRGVGGTNSDIVRGHLNPLDIWRFGSGREFGLNGWPANSVTPAERANPLDAPVCTGVS
jgi:hypothetical protein